MLSIYTIADPFCRISQLEMLDEIEELDLILDHYAVTWGLNLPIGSNGSGWSEWRITKKVNVQEEDDY